MCLVCGLVCVCVSSSASLCVCVCLSLSQCLAKKPQTLLSFLLLLFFYYYYKNNKGKPNQHDMCQNTKTKTTFPFSPLQSTFLQTHKKTKNPERQKDDGGNSFFLVTLLLLRSQPTKNTLTLGGGVGLGAMGGLFFSGGLCVCLDVCVVFFFGWSLGFCARFFASHPATLSPTTK